MLGSSRSRYQSTLKAIDLVAIAKDEDIVRYGMDVFLQLFVQDLKSLYCDGITITVGSEKRSFLVGILLSWLRT